MVKIGLIDVDGHNFPNLALMKLSTYHKAQGHSVEWVNPLFGSYDLVYQAKVFTFTPDFDTCIRAKQIIKGGTGYGLDNKLPIDVENIYPDYSMYGVKNTAYGFLTRGCPRACDFCIVASKEGCKSTKVADLKQFWDGQKEIKLLDPNLLACTDRMELLDQLIQSRARVDFTQGLDVRLLSDGVIDKIKQVKIEVIHFAWDKEKDSKTIIKKLEHFKKQTNISLRKAKVYMLTNFDTSFDFDLYRVYKLKSMGYDPYVMIFNKQNADVKYRKLQRWVNSKIIFHSGSAETFEDYLKHA